MLRTTNNWGVVSYNLSSLFRSSWWLLTKSMQWGPRSLSIQRRHLISELHFKKYTKHWNIFLFWVSRKTHHLSPSHTCFLERKLPCFVNGSFIEHLMLCHITITYFDYFIYLQIYQLSQLNIMWCYIRLIYS
jgi:hypothetical protein